MTKHLTPDAAQRFLNEARQSKALRQVVNKQLHVTMYPDTGVQVADLHTRDLLEAYSSLDAFARAYGLGATPQPSGLTDGLRRWHAEGIDGSFPTAEQAMSAWQAASAVLPFTDVPGLTRWLQDQMGPFGKPDEFVLVIGDDQYSALQRMLEAAQHFPADPGGYDRLLGVQLARVRPPCFRLAQWKDTTE